MPKTPPRQSFLRRNWQVITGLVTAVVLLGAGLYIQHRSDNPAQGDTPAATSPGSATYQGDITEVDLNGLYAGSVIVQPSGQRRAADVQTAGTETGDLRLLTTVRGNKLTVRQTGDCIKTATETPCAAVFTLSVPTRARITGASKGADITFDRIRGEVNVKNAGDLTANGTSGRLRLTTDSGTIVLSDSRSQNVEVLTRNGNVTLGFKTVPSEVDATTDKGDVDVQLPNIAPYKVTADAPAGSKQVTVKQAESSTRAITVRSNSGSVVVRN